MATTIPFEDELMKLLFHGTTIPGLAQNVTVTPITEFHVSLHTQNPLNSPTPVQTTAEVNYASYARQVITRDANGWTINNGTVISEEVIEFPEVSGVISPQNATYFGIGTVLSGAGKLLFTGTLIPAIGISNGVQPRIDNKSIASRFTPNWT